MAQKIHQVFKTQQAYKYTLRKSNAAQRIAKLKALRETIEKYETQIYIALQHDLRKSTFETAVTELFFIYGELDFAVKNLSAWMSVKRVGKTIASPFSKNRLYYEPKGVCLIIAPWNYPFQLTMSPLISAIAAGNCVILKPSELSAATSNIVNKIIKEAFDEQEVSCFEGNSKVAKELLTLPFDHIFFTGSTEVGKIVMEAAAKNLSTVTLELGGKSPTIIDQDVNILKVAVKIAWGKLVNSGQTCIAPDYVLIHEQQLDEFVEAYKVATKKMFFKKDETIDEAAYGKIISQRHFQRLKLLLDEAIDKGARLDFGGTVNESNQTILPAVLSNIPKEAKVMEEEIFGPILPIVTYNDINEAIDFVNTKSKALALYIFSNNRKNIKNIIKNTSAGGTCVNDVLIHISNPKLPFGGINGSGMGSSHGVYGFNSFSHERTVVFQRKLDFNRFIYPPYVGKDWVLKLLKKIM
jgi:aldehyde dehydrogenase (NAD+)